MASQVLRKSEGGNTSPRIWAVDYSYVDGNTSVKLATFYFDGRKIWFEITYSGEAIDSDHFQAVGLRQQLRHLLELPLVRARLRERTMPWFFKRLESNSMEHFQAIPHDSTYYQFSPIRRI